MRKSMSCKTPECKPNKRKAFYMRDQYSKPKQTTFEVYLCPSCNQEMVVKPKSRKYM